MYREGDQLALIFQVEDGSELFFSIDTYMDSMERMAMVSMQPVRCAVKLQDEIIQLFPAHRILHFMAAAVALFSPSPFLHEEHILTRIYPI